MKQIKLFSLFLMIFCSSFLLAQSPPSNPVYNFWNAEMQSIAKPTSELGYVYFKNNLSTLPTEIFINHKAAFGLDNNDEMQIIKQHIDELGWKHIWFQRYRNNLMVVSDVIVVHVTPQGNPYLGLGKLTNDVNYTSVINIDFNNAITIAKNFINANEYMWEDSLMENQLKSIKNDPNATYFPNERIIYLKDNINPLYEIDIVSKTPFHSTKVLIDANTGNVVASFDNHDHAVSINTTHYGQQDINTSLGPNNEILLFDDTRGNGIEQRYFFQLASNFSEGTARLGVDYFGYILDEYHWINSMVYDFYNFYKPSNNSLILPNIYTLIFNNSGGTRYDYNLDAVYLKNNAGSTIDLIAHEWGHGVMTHNLISPNFLGGDGNSISEGFADICGIMAEKYINDVYTNEREDTWIWCKECNSSIDKRNLKTPNNTSFGFCSYAEAADTYLGDYWRPLSDGQCGEYSNSLIFSHWFYLLSNGGAGVNDFGYKYDVCSISKNVAFKYVLYSIANGYFSVNPATIDYIDLRNSMVLGAEVYFGLNSNEYNQVIEAFNAIGLYPSSGQPTSPLVDHILNETFSQNFSITSPKTLGGEIVVGNNSIFTIDGALIDVNPETKIIVESGSSLVIENNSVLNMGNHSSIEIKSGGNISISNSSLQKSDFSCIVNDKKYSLWNGINFTSNANSQLSIVGSTIKDALCAVYIVSNSNSEPSVVINDNIFTNNATAIYAKGSHFYTSNSIVQITNNNFNDPWLLETNYEITFDKILNNEIDFNNHLQFSGIDNLILDNNDFSKPQISIVAVPLNPTQIPVLSLNTQINQSQQFVYYSTKAVKLESNNVDNDYNCSNNSFQRWENCFWVERTDGNIELNQNIINEGLQLNDFPQIYVLGKCSIVNNTLKKGSKGIVLLDSDNSIIEGNNFYEINQNIYVQGGINNQINENNFNDMLNSTSYEGYGVHIYGALSSVVSDNYLEGGTKYGIVCDNSGSNSSYLFKNLFDSKISIAIQTDMDNSGLKIKCNEFAVGSNNPHWIGLFHIEGTLANQGANCTQGNNYQAGNEWLDNTTSSQNPLHHDIILGQNAYPFEYWAHAYEDISQEETTKPRKNNFPTGYITYCENQNLNASDRIQIKTNSSCLDIYDGWYRPADDGILDADLLGQLNDLIIIRGDYLNDLATLESQLIDPDLQKEIVNKIVTLNKEIKIVNDGIIKIYTLAGNDIAVKSLLESENNVESKMLLIEKYKAEGDMVNAQRVLNEILLIYNPDYTFTSLADEQNYEDNKNYYVEIANIENSLHVEGRDLNELNVAEIQTLETISNSDLPISAKAQVMLAYTNGVLNQRPIKKLSETEMNDLLYGNPNEFNYNMTLTPNPADQVVDVCVNLPADATFIKLKLIDEYNQVGLLLETKEVSQGELCKQFSISSYLSGTYRVVLEHDNQIATGAHLLIQH